MAPRHRRSTALAVLAAASLAVPAVVGCSAVEKALDCARTADTIAKNVNDLEQAASDAAENPGQARDALDRIDKNLDSLGDKTDNADVSKAVDALHKGVKDNREAINEGRAPDVTPVTDAAGELTKVCTPG